MEYLVMRLYGPMASWGDIAIGESRHSYSGPTKSALMGLIAAALGVKREEEELHLALNHGYNLASAVHAGNLLRDYHTVQAPDSVGKFHYRTRRDELTVGRDRLGTVLSSREYRTDSLTLIALSANDHSPYTVSQLVEALKKPIFVPYLGRKACPLAAPMEPQLIEAANFAEAFKCYQPLIELNTINELGTTDYFWEGQLNDFSEDLSGYSQVMQLVFHDQLCSRKRWQFEPRNVYHMHVSEES